MTANRGWYLSSVKYAAVAAWTASGSSAVGDFIRATAPTTGNAHVFRCTAAGTRGTTEPTWGLSTIGTTTTTDGGVTWLLVSGLAAYGWAAAAGHSTALNGVSTATTALTGGDTVYIDSAHAQTQATALLLSNPAPASLALPVNWVSVTTAGSVPPVAADYTPGASFATTGTNNITINGAGYGNWYGCTFNSGYYIYINSVGYYPTLIKDGLLWLNTASGSPKISGSGPAQVILNNTPVKFGSSQHGFQAASYPFALEWKNTASAVQGTVPAKLFLSNNNTASLQATVHGVDLSAMTSGQLVDTTLGLGWIELFQCKLASAVTASAGAFPTTAPGTTIDLVDCDSGATVTRCERWNAAGSLVTDTTYTRVGGASTFSTGFAHKIVTAANPGAADPALSFPMYVPNSLVGSARTVTIEVLSLETVTLNPNDKDSRITLSGGNLVATIGTAGTFPVSRATPFISAGKWFWSVKANAVTTAANYNIGAAGPALGLATQMLSGSSFSYQANSSISNLTATSGASSPGAYTTGDVIDIAADFDNQLVWFRKNGGNWNGSAANNPTTGVGGGGYSMASVMNLGPLAPAWNASVLNEQATFNFGASAFTYAAPTGFTALNSYDMSLKTTDAILDVDYVQSASYPDGRVASSEPAAYPLALPAAISTSTATWNGSLTGGVTRKLTVTFTPQSAGILRAQVRVQGLARTIYIDPQPTVT